MSNIASNINKVIVLRERQKHKQFENNKERTN